jgi:hypothetical protein
MRPLPHPSANPLPSWASRPATPYTHVVPFTDACRQIGRWITGRKPRQTMRERQLEAAAVERLVDELEAETDKSKGRDGATAI